MESRTEAKYVLTMNEEEARWLMGLVQNSPVEPDLEDTYNRDMRESFFKAIQKELPAELPPAAWIPGKRN